MNLSQVTVDLQEETKVDIQPQLRNEESRLLRIIEAIEGIEGSKEWSSLKTELFDNLVNVLERDIKTEARKDDPSTNKLNRLSGELKWAEKYADLSKLSNTYKVQLQNVRQKLYGKHE